MLSYEDFTRYAPPASSKDERDQWFIDHDVQVADLLRVGQEVAAHRLSSLEDGAQVGTRELVLLCVSMFAFGYELAVRCERDEAPDLTGRNGDEPA